MGVIPYRNTAAGKARPVPAKASRQEAWRFYASAAWRRLRGHKLAVQPVCEHCEREGRTEVAIEVHHDKARRSHPHLELVLDNLIALCKQCHAREENRRRRG
jgi:5-methylcytosine-specific restriction protein A